MRKLKIESSNVEVQVGSWGEVYIDNESLERLVHNNIEEGNFRAKITIIIEQVENGFTIESNKPEPEPQEVEDTEE